MQTTITGKAYVLGDNVDTDQIIPAQYLTYNPAVAEEYKMFGKFALSSVPPAQSGLPKDRKSTRLNSSHRCISYAVFCLKKKKKIQEDKPTKTDQIT